MRSRFGFTVLFSNLICISLLWLSGARANLSPQGEAPSAGQLPGNWSSGIKQGFGTAYEAYDVKLKYSSSSSTSPISKVWFTVAQGIPTEIFWPRLDTAQVKDSQFLVTGVDANNQPFFFEERKDSQTEVRWLETGVPAFEMTNRDPKGRFLIQRIIFSDPDRDVVLQKIRLTRYQKGLRFYALHKPSVAGTPFGDTALASLSEAPGSGLFAWQGSQAQALIFSIPLKQVSAGFTGPTDGWADLSRDFEMNHHYRMAKNGNVVLTAWLDIPEDAGVTELTMALGFGSDIQMAHNTAIDSLATGVDSLLQKYQNQWKSYQSSLRDLSQASADKGILFRSSVAVLKSMEDKTFEGGFVASPTVPWGQHLSDNSVDQPLTGYHVVWPRDLYQMATSFLALQDSRTAVAALNFLKRVQHSHQDGVYDYGPRKHSKNGSFPQNMWLDGRVNWAGLQMDQVAMPVILAYRLWKEGHIELTPYWDMVRRASDFIADMGPWSAQERWEENFGASPSTIAAEIAGLYVASECAAAMKDFARATRYRETAEAWSHKSGDNVDVWTFTTTGGAGNGRYFQRVEGARAFDQVWMANDDAQFFIGNGGGAWREKDVLDGGFLELVRFGVRRALNGFILDTLPEYDEKVGHFVPGHGMGFHRYNGDRYNYDETSGQNTAGMIWPLLTGERGHFELGKALESGWDFSKIDALTLNYTKIVESFGTREHLIPEQVWDDGAFAGKPTGSATPLGWSHGEYIKFLRSRADRRIFDRLQAVYQNSH